ncbi:hypothetical protein ACFV1F_39400, partial [Streptomyces sp. NPDC059590]
LRRRRRPARAVCPRCGGRRGRARGPPRGGPPPADRERYLGIIEERCRLRVNGASWQAATYHRARGRGLDRDGALAAMTRRYCELMRTGEPVHTWPVGLAD